MATAAVNPAGGPAAPDLISYTILRGRCAGQTIKLQRISPFLVRAVQKQFPPPPPPMNKVVIGPLETDTDLRPNPSDPDYQKQLQEHALFVSEKLIELCAIRGILCEFGEQQRNEAQELRKDLAQIGVGCSEYDKVVYITYILLEDADELKKVTSLIYTNSVPTEAEITENQDLFRPED